MWIRHNPKKQHKGEIKTMLGNTITASEAARRRTVAQAQNNYFYINRAQLYYEAPRPPYWHPEPEATIPWKSANLHSSTNRGWSHEGHVEYETGPNDWSGPPYPGKHRKEPRKEPRPEPMYTYMSGALPPPKSSLKHGVWPNGLTSRPSGYEYEAASPTSTSSSTSASFYEYSPPVQKVQLTEKDGHGGKKHRTITYGHPPHPPPSSQRVPERDHRKHSSSRLHRHGQKRYHHGSREYERGWCSGPNGWRRGSYGGEWRGGFRGDYRGDYRGRQYGEQYGEQ